MYKCYLILLLDVILINVKSQINTILNIKKRERWNKQLHPPVCALAGASDRLNLALHWLAHTGVNWEVTLGKVS